MDRWVSKYNSVGDVRGKGLSIGIDIVSDKNSKHVMPVRHLKFVITALSMA